MLAPAQQTPNEVKAVFGDPDLLPHGEENITPLAQLKRMQRVLYRDTVDSETDKKTKAQLACAWERLEARKAVLVGKPGTLSGRVDVQKPRRTRRASESIAPVSLPTPSLEPAQAPPTAPESTPTIQ